MNFLRYAAWACMFSIAVNSAHSAWALKFEDVLEQMLVAPDQERTQPGGQGHYFYSAGDPIIRKQEYTVYFSGFTIEEGRKVLQLTLIEGSHTVPLTYPGPQIIKVRDIRLRVVELTNEYLEIELLARSPVK